MWTTTVVRKQKKSTISWLLVAAIFNKPMTVLRYNVLTDLPRDGVFIGGCCILTKMLSGIKKRKKSIFFVKSQKTELALQFYFCIDVWRTSCVTLQESLLFLHWCYTQRKTYAVLWGVLYSIHIPTSISVLCSVCFILNTWPILLKHFMSFSLTKKTTQPYDTWGLQLSPLRGSKRGREPRLMERLRRWKAE